MKSTVRWLNRKMNPNLTAFLRRSEEVEVNGAKFIVRELPTAADMTAMRDNADHSYLLLIGCVFCEDGITPAFSASDIPDIKEQTSVFRMEKLYRAVHRVNGLDAEAEVKNSEAVPTSG